MKIGKKRIEDFLKDVASNNPTPGGGAMAAVAGAMAAALVEMVVNLSIGKKRYEKQSQALRTILRNAKNIKENLLVLADEDTIAFDKVIKAYRSKDKKRIKEALLIATYIPGQTAKLAKEIGRLAVKVAVLGNKNAYSDAVCAQHLAEASVKSAFENIKINKKALASLK